MITLAAFITTTFTPLSSQVSNLVNIGQVKNKCFLTSLSNKFICLYIYAQGNEVRFNYALTPCVENTNACLQTQNFFGM